MSKLFRMVLVFVILLTISCKNDVETNTQILQYVPENSKIVVSTADLSDLSQFAKSNKLFLQLKELNRIQDIYKAGAFLSDHKLQDPSLITISLEGKNDVVVTLIAPMAKNLYTGDTLNSNPTSITYDGHQITKMTKNDNSFYSTTHEGYYLASSSQLVIESLVRRSLSNYVFSKPFATVFNKSNSSDTAIYVDASQSHWLEQFLLNNNPKKEDAFADWFKLDLIDTASYGLELDGILSYRDSTLQSQRFYNKLNAVPNKVQFIAPITATTIKATSYSNPDQLIENLRVNNVKMSSTINDILLNSTEISELNNAGERAVVFSLLPYESFFMDLELIASAKSTYRNNTIFKLKNPIDATVLEPIITGGKLPYISLVGDYLLLGPTARSLENIIANYESQAVYAKQSWWESAMENMSTSSSLLHITSLNHLLNSNSTKNQKDLKLLKSIDGATYPAVISQYAHEDEYAHYHLIVPKSKKTNDAAITTQIGTYKSTEQIIAGPFLFPNHNTNRHDVAFQDASGNLHLLTDEGTKLWSKKIIGTIMGDIVAIDGLKNNKFQLVFNTENTLYMLDRNGDATVGFPVNFKDAVTQPVSVFDYDNKRDYRLAVTQGSNLIMYDPVGRKIPGFSYAPGATITTQPLHIKVNGDDFIAFAKANNSIAILNRTGGVRTKVKEQLEITGELYEHKNGLSAKTADGSLVSINLSTGAITKTGNVPSDALYAASGSMQITATNNKVLLNGENVTIPFGTFENLQVTQLKDVPYAHFIESGEKKAYIVDKFARIVESMPVFGTGKTALAQSKHKYLVTLDGNDIIIYKW